MQRVVVALMLVGAVAGVAHADDAAVEVTRSQLPSPYLLGVSIGGGVRQIGGAERESATGLVLGVEVGKRMRSRFGAVAVLEADAMAREDYVSYGVWTVGLGVRWDGPVILTAGAGLAHGSSTRLTSDLRVESDTMAGATAFVHGVVPFARVGRARFGVAGNLAIKALDDGTISGLSAGVAAVW